MGGFPPPPRKDNARMDSTSHLGAGRASGEGPHTRNLSPHRIGLLALYTLESLIVSCRGTGPNLLRHIAFLIPVLALMPLAMKVLGILYSKEVSELPPAPRVGIATLDALTCVLSLAAAIFSLRELSCFVGMVIIPGLSEVWALIPFLALCLWIAAAPPGALLKISLLFFPLVAVSVAGLFLLSIPHFSLAGLPLPVKPDLSLALLGIAGSPTGRIAAGLYPALALLSLERRGGIGETVPGRAKRAARDALLGLLAGCGLLALACAQSLLVFGDSYLATLAYPYLSAVGVLSSDEAYLRADGLVYIIFFACSMVKCGVCFSCVARICGRYGKKIPPLALALCGGICLLLTLVLR